MKGIEIVTGFLGRVTYPIDKTKLVEAAHNFRMGNDVVQTVEALPDKVFASLEDVIPYVQKQNAEKGVGGVGKNIGNAIGGARETAGNVGKSEDHEVFAPMHPELDALAKTRRRPSQAEGEREVDKEGVANWMSEDEGRSQST